MNSLSWLVRPLRETPVAVRVLAFLLAVDCVLLLVHGSRGLAGVPASSRFSLTYDWSVGEIFQYCKELLLLVVLIGLFRRLREPAYLALALVAGYLLLDDSLQLHEKGGEFLAISLGMQPAFRLRAIDFGELIVISIAGVIVAGALLVSFARSGPGARAFSIRMTVMLLALAVFGVLADMLHVMTPVGADYVGTVEDFGEMVVMSGIVALVVAEHRDPRLMPGPMPVNPRRHGV